MFKILQLRNVYKKILVKIYLNKNTGKIIKTHLCTALEMNKLQFKALNKVIRKAKIIFRLLFILIGAKILLAHNYVQQMMKLTNGLSRSYFLLKLWIKKLI